MTFKKIEFAEEDFGKGRIDVLRYVLNKWGGIPRHLVK